VEAAAPVERHLARPLKHHVLAGTVVDHIAAHNKVRRMSQTVISPTVVASTAGRRQRSADVQMEAIRLDPDDTSGRHRPPAELAREVPVPVEKRPLAVERIEAGAGVGTGEEAEARRLRRLWLSTAVLVMAMLLALWPFPVWNAL
jgi:hypothetical protein